MSYFVTAGEKKNRVTLQRPVPATTSFGQKIPTQWADVITLWARIRTPRGKEILRLSQVQSLATHVIEHAWPGFQPPETYRYKVDDGRIFNIESSVDEEERRIQITSYCVEVRSPVGT